VTRSFERDVFSRSKPEWLPVTDEVAATINALVPFLPPGLQDFVGPPEQSGTFNVNSSNLRLRARKKSVVLKRWSLTRDRQSIQKTLDLMHWLSECGLPVPRPIRFANGGCLLDRNGALWSLFPLVTGDYFAGDPGELDSAAHTSGSLLAVLSRCPDNLLPERGPEYLTDEDDRIIHETERERANWEEKFGRNEAAQLKRHWHQLREQWASLRNSPPEPGPTLPAHIDLHPHNLLMHNGEVKAILDFESCRVIPVGYASAFAALKQCRQAVAVKGNTSTARAIGREYSKRLSTSYPVLKPLLPNFSRLAAAEVMRRICIILELNLQHGDTRWNCVLPIQLNHLYESEALFSP
jgi:hypothetical protein